MIRHFFLIFSVFLCFFAGCRPTSDWKSKTFSGTLEYTEYNIGPSVSGKLEQVHFEEGENIHKAQLLATLERHDQAQRDYQRLVQLAKNGGATEQAVEQAKLFWTDQKITSPIEGVILIQVHQAGEVVAAGSPVAILGDTQKPWVKIFIPEGEINLVKINQTAWLKFDGVDQKIKGHVHYISPQAEFTPRNVQSTEERILQTFAVKIILDDKADFLRPGISADVHLEY